MLILLLSSLVSCVVITYVSCFLEMITIIMFPYFDITFLASNHVFVVTKHAVLLVPLQSGSPCIKAAKFHTILDAVSSNH